MTVVLGIAALALLPALLFVRTIPAHAHLVDGDTIDVRGTRWRLAGFDAPERDQPGGSDATAHLRTVLAHSHKIAFVGGRDAYGRRLAHVWTTRGSLAWRMVASGHAHPLTKAGLLPLLWARIRGNGIWDGSHAVVPPRIWRAAHPRG